MKQLHPFMYGPQEVRTIVIENQPWFAAKDICEVLELTNATVSIQRLDDDEVTKLNLGGLNGETNFINEPGLYSLILGSRKPEAKQFKRWITHEVIPSIRKHGAYMSPETIEKTLTSPDFIIGLATKLKEEQARAAQLEQQIVKDTPKRLFAESLLTSNDCILIANLAKLLKQNGVETGEKRLYRWLRENGYLGIRGDHYNMPTQRSMDLRLFEVKTGVLNRPDEEPRPTKTTVVTGRGQMYFLNKFKDQTA